MIFEHSFFCDIIVHEGSNAMTLKVKVECRVCGRQFTVPNLSSLIPKHPPKGEEELPSGRYRPCRGSGTIGRNVN